MPQILLCCVLALLLAALGLLLRSLRRRSRPSGGNETLKVLLVCFFTCGILLHLPMYAAAYAGERVVFGKPLSVNQAVQWPLAELQTVLPPLSRTQTL